MPVPAVTTPQHDMARRDNGPVLPLPAAGETLFAFLDRLLANLPLLVMRFFAAFVLAAAVSAQEIGFADGPKVAAGASAIDNPNVNNGVQVDSSLVASPDAAGNTLFNHIAGSHFTNVNENLSVQDNLANNPGFASIEGNSGWTADGDGNFMGPVQNDLRGSAMPLLKRAGDVVFANNRHSDISAVSMVYSPYAPSYYAPAFVSYPVSVVTPVHYRPAHKVHPGYTASAPAAEAPKHEYQAPVAEAPKHEYQAPVVEAPKYASKAPAAEAPKHEEPVTYSASPITNVKYAKAL
ncbi:hypothetical protein IW140_004661 [Coemansia sp. RSA 1813]|nr:hypothetical protein LPJ74_005262 [Coemansia sp. RSA 1843]KAJ2087617.1 hypothetical protein IW138_004820 [Coemansia sp. RSA 986]KAJ2214362.1 hypothetical protein EV179_003027 [Coemansia sp. RSA 487]KAJ2567094.1 hypothetical protein IW140_004661 [Coemansia sp. RSA 1813]